ncbi:hypothetical protein R3P38DRAFT_3545182 [Favolaschia claudopus]|uniref:Uncharacterized protein n=1 Tax=Favolaschia claudopus TaxID=2862362 RepID=A0AAW0E2V5_9AGAR
MAFNTVPCGGHRNEKEGCMEIFPQAPPGELCQRCLKLKAAATATIRKELEESLKSCEGCGLCGNDEVQQMRDVSNEGTEREWYGRSRNCCFTSNAPRKTAMNLVNQPLGATTPIQELEHLKSAIQKGNWTVLVHPHRGQAKDKDMEVKEQIMDRYNGQWTSMRNHPLDLKENECSLHFPGNIEIDTVTQDMTLQGLYTFYQSRLDHAVVNVNTKLKLPKGTSLVFEFCIKEKLYIERVASMIDDGDDDIFTGTKRKRGSAVSKLASSKRLNAGTVSTLTLSFNPHDDFSILSSKPETSKITFTTIRSEPVVGSEGRYELTKDNTERIGYIETKPLILSMAD